MFSHSMMMNIVYLHSYFFIIVFLKTLLLHKFNVIIFYYIEFSHFSFACDRSEIFISYSVTGNYLLRASKLVTKIEVGDRDHFDKIDVKVRIEIFNKILSRNGVWATISGYSAYLYNNRSSKLQ